MADTAYLTPAGSDDDLAAIQQNATLLGELSGGRDNTWARSGQSRWIYWKKPEYGSEPRWVSKGPFWPSEFMRQLRKGCLPLPAYGEFLPELAVHNGQQWDPHRDPFRLILLTGGAHEFPRDQVISLNWHRSPPRGFSAKDFPQLGSEPIPAHRCQYCRKLYNTEQDLQSHEIIAHKDISAQQSLARELANATQGSLTGPFGDLVRMLVDSQKDTAGKLSANDDKLMQLLQAVVAIQGQAQQGGRGQQAPQR